MGEVAEMMLDGTLCAGCGVAMIHSAHEDPAGFPVYCSFCKAEGRGQPPRVSKKTRCPICKKRVRKAGLEHHKRDMHPEIVP